MLVQPLSCPCWEKTGGAGAAVRCFRNPSDPQGAKQRFAEAGGTWEAPGRVGCNNISLGKPHYLFLRPFIGVIRLHIYIYIHITPTYISGAKT